MTECEEFILLMNLQLDGELSKLEEERLLDHLASCEDCASLYQDLSRIQETLSGFSGDPPADLSQRIMEQIREAVPERAGVSSPKRKPLYVRRFATMAAALLLLISGMVLSHYNVIPTPFGNTMDKVQKNSEEALEDRAAPQEKLQADVAQDSACEPAPFTTDEDPVTRKKSAPLPPTTKEALPSPPLTGAGPEAKSEESYGTKSFEPEPEADRIYGFAAPPSEPSPAETEMQEFASAQGHPDASDGVTFDEAVTLLLVYLTNEENPSPSITYLSTTPDGESYCFLYTDGNGLTWQYSVSSIDGSILLQSSPEKQTSSRN